MKKVFFAFQTPIRRRAEKVAQALQDQRDKVSNCPVCDVKSLVIFEESDSYPSEEDENVEIGFSYTHAATCMNCGFDVHGQDMKNASEYGISEIEDYWEYRQWS